MIPLNSNLATLKRSAIRVYTNLARQTPDCAMLTIGEPDFDTPEAVKQAACRALFQGQTHYAPNQGTNALRSAIAAYETGRGNPTAPEAVLTHPGLGAACAVVAQRAAQHFAEAERPVIIAGSDVWGGNAIDELRAAAEALQASSASAVSADGTAGDADAGDAPSAESPATVAAPRIAAPEMAHACGFVNPPASRFCAGCGKRLR